MTSLLVPWVGSASGKKVFTIAVLSENRDIVQNLFSALLDVNAKGNYQWKLNVIGSRSFGEILEQLAAAKQAMDFVVLAVDTSRPSCIKWASDVLNQVDPDLRIGRVMLLNASGLPVNEMAVYPSDIISFCSENRLDMLNANIFKPEDAAFAASRLIRCVEQSLGVNTGIPNLN